MVEAADIITKAVAIPGTDITFDVNPLTILRTWGACLFILLFFFLLKWRVKEVPHRGQSLLEMIVGWFDGVLKESLGEDGRKFLPFIATLFIFVLVCNWMSVIPGVIGPTRDLNLPLGLALVVFLVAHASAIKKKGVFKYVKSYFEPFWFLFPSNVFSEISKVLSHSFRLYGNIFAGGIIISLVPVIFWQLFKWTGFAVAVPVNTILTVFFGLFLGGIQAFVFALLAVAYISVLR